MKRNTRKKINKNKQKINKNKQMGGTTVCDDKIRTLLAFYLKSLNPFEQYKFKKANDQNMIKLLEHYLDGNIAAALKSASQSNKSFSGGSRNRTNRTNRTKKKLTGGAYIRELQSCTGNPVTDLVEFVLTQGLGVIIKVLQKEGVSLIGAVGQIIDELNEVIPGHFNAQKFLGLTSQHADLKLLHTLMKQLHPTGVPVGDGATAAPAEGAGGPGGPGGPGAEGAGGPGGPGAGMPDIGALAGMTPEAIAAKSGASKPDKHAPPPKAGDPPAAPKAKKTKQELKAQQKALDRAAKPTTPKTKSKMMPKMPKMPKMPGMSFFKRGRKHGGTRKYTHTQRINHSRRS